METIAVIGAGMMGPGIAQVFATHGCSVFIHNRSSEKLGLVHERVRTNLAQMAEYGLVEAAEIPSILDRIVTTSDLSAACNGASVVIETITESLPLKQELFVELDRLCPPETILCSNTSVLSITQIGLHAVIGSGLWVCTFTSRRFWCRWLKSSALKRRQLSIWSDCSPAAQSGQGTGACAKRCSGIYCESHAARVVARGLCAYR